LEYNPKNIVKKRRNVSIAPALRDIKDFVEKGILRYADKGV
jgi:hypothetical protein